MSDSNGGVRHRASFATIVGHRCHLDHLPTLGICVHAASPAVAQRGMLPARGVVA